MKLLTRQRLDAALDLLKEFDLMDEEGCANLGFCHLEVNKRRRAIYMSRWRVYLRHKYGVLV